MKKYSLLFLLLAVGGESANPISLDSLPLETKLPSVAFLYKHGYEYVGTPVPNDPRIPLLRITTSMSRHIGTSFYTKHRQYTAQHVSENMGGFTQIGQTDAAWRVAMPRTYFKVNSSPLAYRGVCVAYGYVDNVLRRYDGKIIGTLPVSTGSELITDFRVRGGTSGGVVLDKDGLVLGVISSTIKDKQTLVIPIKGR